MSNNLQRFYVTFGYKYKSEPHPNYHRANPDGYVVINAESEEKARQQAFKVFGNYWSFIYSEEKMQFHFFPKGCLDTFTAES